MRYRKHWQMKLRCVDQIYPTRIIAEEGVRHKCGVREARCLPAGAVPMRLPRIAIRGCMARPTAWVPRATQSAYADWVCDHAGAGNNYLVDRP